MTADNLVQLFFGWEGVGLASYLLINFYFSANPRPTRPRMKAFIVNRVGGFRLPAGHREPSLLPQWIRCASTISSPPRAGPCGNAGERFLWAEWNAANLIAFLLFVGAMGKIGAWLFLHTWLPDAMEGPTPDVGADPRRQPMVTAGVFLVCRMSPIIGVRARGPWRSSPPWAATAFFAATVGLVQEPNQGA